MHERVVHCRKAAYDVYIGRGSKWGNPFKLYHGYGRDEVIAMYREWIVEQPELLRDVWNGELRGQVLGCWCAPFDCHGEVLVELDEEAERAEIDNKITREEWITWKFSQKGVR